MWTLFELLTWNWYGCSCGARRGLNTASMPADKTQANQGQGVGKVPNLIPASLQDTPVRKCGKALCRMASMKNAIWDQASHTRKQQDLTVYPGGWVTEDQSGWGFTVKQAATTIHEGSAAYTVSTSGLTKEVEAVIHALCWLPQGDSQTTYTIILTDSMSLLQRVKHGKGNPERNVSMVNIHLQILLWLYALNMPEWREITELIDWQTKQPSQIACLGTLI